MQEVNVWFENMFHKLIHRKKFIFNFLMSQQSWPGGTWICEILLLENEPFSSPCVWNSTKHLPCFQKNPPLVLSSLWASCMCWLIDGGYILLGGGKYWSWRSSYRSCLKYHSTDFDPHLIFKTFKIIWFLIFMYIKSIKIFYTTLIMPLPSFNCMPVPFDKWSRSYCWFMHGSQGCTTKSFLSVSCGYVHFLVIFLCLICSYIWFSYF